MNEKPVLLLVEDDDFAALVATEMLSAHYTIQHVSSGAAALQTIAAQAPDLVLLDVDMPLLSGYAVCRRIRDELALSDLPVIFLSGMVSDQDRLAGYEAGGDDYLTKPVTEGELRSRIGLALARYTEQRSLKADLASTFSTAMTAMSSASEVGAVLQFMRSSMICADYTSLCHEVLNTLGAYGLEASVQIRGQQPVISMSTHGPCSPLEESVLTNMSKQGRLFEFGQRTSCSYEHITLIVKSDAKADPERHGRMKDSLAWLAEGADARVISLDDASAILRQHAALAQLNVSTCAALQHIDQRHRSQAIKSNQIFEDLYKNFDRSMLTLGISNSQEDELLTMIQNAAKQEKALYDEGLEIAGHLETLLTQLKNAGA